MEAGKRPVIGDRSLSVILVERCLARLSASRQWPCTGRIFSAKGTWSTIVPFEGVHSHDVLLLCGILSGCGDTSM